MATNMSVNKQMLSTNELLILSSEMNKREKSLPMAFLMLLLGHLGIHRFYLKRYVSGALQLGVFLLAFISYIGFAVVLGVDNEMDTVTYAIPGLLVVGVFILTALGLTVWVIVDACLLTGMVKRWNAELELSIIREIIQFRNIQQSGTNNNGQN